MAQRLARDERHNIEEEVVLRAGGEDWEDVRVLQVGSDSDFLPEARSTDLAREFGREQFYDDLPVERRLSREEETTHAAAAELALDVVGVAEDTLHASSCHPLLEFGVSDARSCRTSPTHTTGLASPSIVTRSRPACEPRSRPHIETILRCYEPRGAPSSGSPMPRGEQIAKPTERDTRLVGSCLGDSHRPGKRGTHDPAVHSPVARWRLCRHRSLRSAAEEAGRQGDRAPVDREHHAPGRPERAHHRERARCRVDGGPGDRSTESRRTTDAGHLERA